MSNDNPVSDRLIKILEDDFAFSRDRLIKDQNVKNEDFSDAILNLAGQTLGILF